MYLVRYSQSCGNAGGQDHSHSQVLPRRWRGEEAGNSLSMSEVFWLRARPESSHSSCGVGTPAKSQAISLNLTPLWAGVGPGLQMKKLRYWEEALQSIVMGLRDGAIWPLPPSLLGALQMELVTARATTAGFSHPLLRVSYHAEYCTDATCIFPFPEDFIG